MSLRDGNPTDIDAYRQTTARHAATASITQPRFMCRVCNQSRPSAGRESLGYKAGYICACCLEQKKARRSAGGPSSCG